MQYTRVISFGDSFTWGSELKDSLDDVYPTDAFADPEKYPREFELIKKRGLGPYSSYDIDGNTTSYLHSYSEHTWPALLAKELGSKYKCHAWPGAGNQTVTRKVFEFLDQYTNSDLLVINWTYISRWDYHQNSGTPRNQWKTIRPDSTGEVADFYHKHIHTEPWEKWETIRNIALVSNTLKQHDINFIMTCNDSLAFNKEHYAINYILNGLNEIEDDIIWFEGQGFYDWSVSNNYPLGKKNGHPLELAHQRAFEYIRDNYDFT